MTRLSFPSTARPIISSTAFSSSKSQPATMQLISIQPLAGVHALKNKEVFSKENMVPGVNYSVSKNKRWELVDDLNERANNKESGVTSRKKGRRQVEFDVEQDRDETNQGIYEQKENKTQDDSRMYRWMWKDENQVWRYYTAAENGEFLSQISSFVFVVAYIYCACITVYCSCNSNESRKVCLNACPLQQRTGIHHRYCPRLPKKQRVWYGKIDQVCFGGQRTSWHQHFFCKSFSTLWFE